MFQITISLYKSYQIEEYVVGGYMYPSTNQWYLPKCIYTGTSTPDIIVGRDGIGNAYISIVNGNYSGVRVHNMTRGYYTTVADTYDPWTITLDNGTENSVTPSVHKVWHSLNDGSGSGLDADTLDGQHGSYYLPTTGKAADSELLDGLNSVVFNRGSNSSGVFPGTSGYDLNNVFTSFPRAGFIDAWSGTNFPPSASHIQGLQVRHATSTHYGWQLAGQYNQPQLWHRYVSNNSWGSWQKIWSSLTDGSGSGLDADTLDLSLIHI